MITFSDPSNHRVRSYQSGTTMSQRASILYLATFDPTVGATGTATRGRLFLRFFSKNYETHLVHLKEQDTDGRDRRLVDRLASVQEIDYSKFGYFLFCPSLYKAAKKVLETKKVDLIFADFEKAGLYAWMLSRRFGVPYVYSSHNVEFLRYLDFAKRNPIRYLLAPYLYAVERLASKSSLFTAVISESDAAAFTRFVKTEKLLVLPCAFDEETFNPFFDETKEESPVVLMVGNYRNTGNRSAAEILCKVIMPEVIKKKPKAIFRIIGKNFPEELRHPNVQAPGFVQDLRAEYERATLVVAPITMGAGIKIKLIEALACGKFVISTPKGLEGIVVAGFENIRITSIAEFPDAIIDAIECQPVRTPRNWDVLRKAYGCQYQLGSFQHKIDHILKARTHTE